MRLLGWLLGAALVASFAACGSDDRPAQAPPGSPENPVEAKPSSLEGATSETKQRPSFADLVDRQRGEPTPRDRANPCALVTKAEAKAILQANLIDPVVAPQGPTCIYRDRSGRSFATVAFQPMGIDDLRRQLRRVQRVEVAGQTAYCGMHGQPMLYLGAGTGRVLSVAAPCDVATRFARRAAERLGG
jgi:hypothetical protein